MLLILLTIFGVAFGRGQGEADARALTLTALVGANLALVVFEPLVIGGRGAALP